MRINLTSVPVNDQEKALQFYTKKLGFVKKEDIPMGEHRWLTVTSPEGAEGVELLLEPIGFPAAKTYYEELFKADIPAAQFESEDLDGEISRLKALGVPFRGEPQEMGGVRFATFEDTCGNLICLTQRA